MVPEKYTNKTSIPFSVCKMARGTSLTVGWYIFSASKPCQSLPGHTPGTAYGNEIVAEYVLYMVPDK
jgi:hypothetical protein